MIFNNNSPIINNMMGNGMYLNKGYMPPTPISNVIGVGTNGYNNMNNGMMNMGGYYNNNYNYYNPYLIQQQQQLQQSQMREQMRQQTDILKTISKSVNKALGADIDMEKHLEQYNPENYYQGIKSNNQYGYYQQDNEQLVHDRLMSIHCNGHTGNPVNQRLIQANNILYEQEKQTRPDEYGIIEFNKSAGELYNEIVQQEQRMVQRDLTKLYNPNQYNQLVKMNGSGNSYFNSMFQGTAMMQNDMNIDDMEVKLPNHLVNTYDERKQAFLNAIFNK